MKIYQQKVKKEMQSMLQEQLDTFRSQRLGKEQLPDAETLEHAEVINQAQAAFGPLSERAMPLSGHRTELSHL